jgi:hypothetical protein
LLVGFSLFSSGTGKSLHFMGWQRLSPAKTVAIGQESFACIAFVEEALPFITQLVPEGVKLGVVRSVYNVAQLVQHGVNNALCWKKLILVLWVT